MKRIKSGLLAGAAQIDITPPIGTPMTGYILRAGPSEGVHDPLFARALAFDDGVTRAAILMCDVLALDRHFVASSRVSVSAATGIPAQNILIAGTHTHSGPATIFLRGCGEVAEAWLDVLRSRAVAVCQQAVDSARPARIRAGRGRVASGVENRRASDGPVDPELGVLCVEDRTGAPIAVLINYACHPTFLSHQNRLFSADYPGFALARIHERTGAVALFATGAGGDIGPVPEHRRPYNPIDATPEPAASGGTATASAFRRAEALGAALADEALRVLPSLERRTSLGVQVASAIVELPLQTPPAVEELEQLAALHRAQMSEALMGAHPLGARVHGAMLGWAEDTLAAIRDERVAASVPAEAQVLVVDGIPLVGVPGEPFVEIGRSIKARARSETVFVIGYANDDVGYIPTREAYARGGYEIDDAFKYYDYPAALSPEAGEAFVERVIGLLEDGL